MKQKKRFIVLTLFIVLLLSVNVNAMFFDSYVFEKMYNIDLYKQFPYDKICFDQKSTGTYWDYQEFSKEHHPLIFPRGFIESVKGVKTR